MAGPLPPSPPEILNLGGGRAISTTDRKSKAGRLKSLAQGHLPCKWRSWTHTQMCSSLWSLQQAAPGDSWPPRGPAGGLCPLAGALSSQSFHPSLHQAGACSSSPISASSSLPGPSPPPPGRGLACGVLARLQPGPQEQLRACSA